MPAILFADDQLVVILSRYLAEQHQLLFVCHLFAVARIVHDKMKKVVSRSHECRLHLTHVHRL